MAGRVNTRFVAALIVVLVLLTLIPAGYWYLFIRADAGTLVKRADQLLTQGSTDKALENYGKAIRLRPGDVDLLLKFADVLSQAKTSDPRTAKNYVGQRIASLQQAITQKPGDPEPYQQLMELYMRLGRELGDFDVWKLMYDNSNTRVSANTDPAHVAVAKKYRGVAQVSRMEQLDLKPEERSQTQQDLADALKQSPDDRDANYYLAIWHVLEARALARAGGRVDEVEQHRQEAAKLSAASLARHPDDPRWGLDRLRILGLLDQIKSDEVKALAAKLEQQLLRDTSSLSLVMELVSLLPQIDRATTPSAQPGQPGGWSGLARSEALLLAALQEHPDEPRLLVAMGRLLEMQRRGDEAMEIYRKIYDLQISAEPFVGVQLDHLRAGATARYIDLLLKKVDADNPESGEPLMAKAQEMIDRLAANYGESGELTLIQGKMAMLRRQWGQASSLLDKANSLFKGAEPEALLLSAKAWVQMGELGAATERLSRLAQLRPDYMPARYELIRLYLSLDRVADAQNHLDAILRVNPSDPYCLRYKAEILAKNGQVEQAIETLSSPAIDLHQHPEFIPLLASFYTSSGQTEVARQLLEDRFSQVPTDVGILQELIRVSENPEQARRYIQLARDAGANAQALEVLESQFDGKTDMVQVLEGLISSDEVPFRRHLRRYQLYRRLGQNDRAGEELEQATKLKPDHPTVVTAGFEKALGDRRWEDAERLAAKAKGLNIDLAQGAFYYGRLYAAQEKFEQAIASYREGLSSRGIYSEGWRELGDVQRTISDWPGAAASYRLALEQRPNNAAALHGLATVQNALGQHDQAIASLRSAVRFAPDNRLLREQYLAYELQYGQVQTALLYREKLLQTDPKDAVNRRELAVLLARLGRVAEAQRSIDDLIREAGVDRPTVAAAAAVRAAASDVEGAIKLIRDYVTGLKDKATDEDWLLLARFYLDTGQDDKAMAAYRQAITHESPKLRRATREYADVLFDRAQYSLAVERYAQLWQTLPEDKRIGQRFVEALLRSNQPDRAKQVLEEVTRKHGVEAGTYVLEAMIARALDHSDDALSALNRAIELDPHRAIAYYQRADLQSSNADLESAVMSDLNRALELDPDLGAARRLLATIHVRRGERNEAIRELAVLIRRNPRHVAARLQLAGLYQDVEQWTQRRALLDESAKLFPSASVWPQLQAQQALIDKDPAKAVVKLGEAFKLTPSPQTLGELASLLIQAGKPQDANTLLRENGEIVRDAPLLHALQGRSLIMIGEADLAKRAFTRAVEHSQSFTDMTAVSVQMMQAVGRDKAVSELELMSETGQPGLVELAIVQLETESQQYQSAMDRLKRIEVLFEESPERSQYERLLALVLHQLGEHDRALAVYQRLLKEQPNNVITLNNAAYLLAEDMNRADEAIPLAQRAVTLAPDNPFVLDTLGWSLFKAGQTESALGVLRRSTRLGSTATSYLHLADVLKQMGDRSGAVEMLKQAKELAAKLDDQESHGLAAKKLDQLTGSVETQ